MQPRSPRNDGPIRTDLVGGIGILEIHRPERFNSLDVHTAQDLRRAGLRLARDPAVRAIVLRGVPGIFCSGVDLRYVRDGGSAEELDSLAPRTTPGATLASRGAIFKQVLEYVNGTIVEIRRAPKPVLAAVDGVAAAGGLGLALCCDLVYASERASFEWAYGKTGLSGAESITFLLPRLIGLRGALDVAWLSPRLDARAALARGLVSDVLATDGFDAAVLDGARRLAEGPTESYARMKRLMNRAVGMEGLEAHLSAEVEALVTSADSPEFAEGLERFFARKRPHGEEE